MFEKAVKLILFLKTNNVPKGHNLLKLMQGIDGIEFDNHSIEFKILKFLSDFADGDRYKLVDFYRSLNEETLESEPIYKFYTEILKEVERLHPLKKKIDSMLKDILSDIVYSFSIKEDFSIQSSPFNAIQHHVLIEHLAKYTVIYIGCLLQPFLLELRNYSGANGNPYFYDHFMHLYNDDKFYKNRKKFYRGK